MDMNRVGSKHVDQSAADAGDQRITGGEGYDASSGDLVEHASQTFSQRIGPRQPQLISELRNQIKVARTAEQHLRGPNCRSQSLWKVLPAPGAQPDHLDHASDCMPLATPE
jgi:hypothetical protein